VTENQLKQLIDRVSDQFQKSTGYSVIGSAREALFRPAVPHLPDVTRELERRRITEAFLENSVREILDNTIEDLSRIKIRYVNGEAVEKSMSRKCPYLFWC